MENSHEKNEDCDDAKADRLRRRAVRRDRLRHDARGPTFTTSQG
jgi:hypothetical protein